MTIPSTDKDVEELELLGSTNGDLNCNNHFEEQMALVRIKLKMYVV